MQFNLVMFAPHHLSWQESYKPPAPLGGKLPGYWQGLRGAHSGVRSLVILEVPSVAHAIKILSGLSNVPRAKRILCPWLWSMLATYPVTLWSNLIRSPGHQPAGVLDFNKVLGRMSVQVHQSLTSEELPSPAPPKVHVVYKLWILHAPIFTWKKVLQQTQYLSEILDVFF